MVDQPINNTENDQIKYDDSKNDHKLRKFQLERGETVTLHYVVTEIPKETKQ